MAGVFVSLRARLGTEAWLLFAIFHFIGASLTNSLGFIDSVVPCAAGGILGIGTGVIHGVGSFFHGVTGFFMPPE